MSKGRACRAESPDGKYCNDMRVGYNAYEFVFDFCQRYDDAGSDTPHTRIITPPTHAKQLTELLLKSIAQYEQRYGAIEPIADAPPSRPRMESANRPKGRAE